MAAPLGFHDLRLFLHSRQIDHAWLRTVLDQYLQENAQTDQETFHDHEVWEFRNTITEFKHLLADDPEDLEDEPDTNEPED